MLHELMISVLIKFCLKYKFLDDDALSKFQNTLDTLMKEHSSVGLAIKRRQAVVISADEENTMHEKGASGAASPQQLLDNFIDSLGLHFNLRGSKEHRNL